MSKFVGGIIVTIAGIMAVTEAYKLGYNKGIDDCTRVLKMVNKVAKAVEDKESD